MLSERRTMKVKNSKVFLELRDKDNTFKVADGSPDLPADVVEEYAQQIHDLLIDKGFTNCWVILHIVTNTLREERDIKRL